jgi:rod shape-determining protein MreC
VSVVTPFEKALVWTQQSIGGAWRNYVYLRGVRAENRELKQQIENMRLEQVRLSEDAGQARRLQVLLGFKEKFIAKTVAAQVVGSSGSQQSRSIYIDKGSADGVKTDQAVITADGIVGKVIDVLQDHTAKVLLINDQSSGAGVILEKSRLQGIVRGTPSGEVVVEKIMSDESVQPGERVLTSGGDQIFPKGLDVGVVTKAAPGSDSFLNIRIKPAANLSKLEEVLVITELQSRLPSQSAAKATLRAVDILAERLPTVPQKPAAEATTPDGTNPANAKKPASAAPSKPASLGAPAAQTAHVPGTAPSGSISQPKSATGTASRNSGSQQTAPQPDSGIALKPAGKTPSTGTAASAASGTSSKPQAAPKTRTIPPAVDKSATPASTQAPAQPPAEDNPQ